MTRRTAPPTDDAVSEQAEHAGRVSGRARMVRCPHCGGDSVYGPGNPYRPFCGARCKGLDFGAWADESFRVAAGAGPDDDPPGVARLQ